jgi:serine/threonine protein kinase
MLAESFARFAAKIRSQIKLYDVIEEDKYIHLVLELCQGSERFDRISDRTVYSETDVAYVVHTMLDSLDYCYGMNICHRDLKP